MPFAMALFLTMILSIIVPVFIFYPGMALCILYAIIVPILFVTHCVELDFIKRNPNGPKDCWEMLFVLICCMYPFIIPLGIIGAHVALVLYYAALPFCLLIITCIVIWNWCKSCKCRRKS